MRRRLQSGKFPLGAGGSPQACPEGDKATWAELWVKGSPSPSLSRHDLGRPAGSPLLVEKGKQGSRPLGVPMGSTCPPGTAPLNGDHCDK